jgi:hypothetical protein
MGLAIEIPQTRQAVDNVAEEAFLGQGKKRR